MSHDRTTPGEVVAAKSQLSLALRYCSPWCVVECRLSDERRHRNLHGHCGPWWTEGRMDTPCANRVCAKASRNDDDGDAVRLAAARIGVEQT